MLRQCPEREIVLASILRKYEMAKLEEMLQMAWLPTYQYATEVWFPRFSKHLLSIHDICRD
jgi:hypothetical protein